MLSSAALAGCFSEPTELDSSGDTEATSTSSSATTTPSSSSSTNSGTSNTSNDVDPDTGDTTSLETTTSSETDETSVGCLGEEGCPCTDPLSPTCADSDLTCVEGICVPISTECVVSYGGNGAPVGVVVSSVRIDPNGEIISRSLLEIDDAHQPGAEVSGQDMLTVCNGRIYAVLSESAEIAILDLDADGDLVLQGQFPVPANGPAGERTLRALECAAPHAPALLAFSVVDDPGIAAPDPVVLHSLPIDEDGNLSSGDPPLLFPHAPAQPSIRVRTAWSAMDGRGFVAFDSPPPQNSSSLHSFDVQGQTGIATLGPTPPPFIMGLQGRLGGIEVTPSGDVAMVGAQVGDPQGSGQAVLFEINADGSYNPTLSTLADEPGETFFFDAKSINFGIAGDAGTQAYVGSAEGFAAMNFSNTPFAGPALDLSGPGHVFAFPVHAGQVIVALDARSIRTYGAPRIPLEAATKLLDEVERDLPAIDAAVRLRCPSGRAP